MQTTDRNYQLDFIKLILAIMIFLCHTQWWADPNANVITPQWLDGIGNITVRVFFIISGMLMANSIAKTDVVDHFGKNAIAFVLRKFTRIMWPVWISIFINILINLWSNSGGIAEAIMQGIKAIPELFMISIAGFTDNYNAPIWFLSAMLICMLPYAYLLYAKKDFTLYVFSPLAAILTSGFIFQASNGGIDVAGFNGIFMNELVRTICGLSLGVCAYGIYDCICRKYRRPNVLFTVIEVLILSIFIYIVAFARESYAVMSILFLIPIAVAISISGTSYIQYIFRQKWLKWCAPLSVQIYINHWAAVRAVLWKFPGHSWGYSVVLTALFTIVFGGINWAIVNLGKILWNNKLKTILCPES